MKFLSTFFIFLFAASAQPAIAPPQVGFLHDGAGSFRPVFGIAGNFLVGATAYGAVTNAAYSGFFGLIKTDSAITAIDSQGRAVATAAAPAGPAVFAFRSDGSPAFVYVPAAHLLFGWSGNGFQAVPFNSGMFPDGAVRAIFAPDAAHLGILVQRVDGLTDVRVLIQTGQMDSQTVVTGVRGPAVFLASGEFVFTDMNGLVVRNPDGSEVHILGPMPAHCSLTQMGAGWVELTDSSRGSQYAVRITAGREGFYTLPEVGQ